MKRYLRTFRRHKLLVIAPVVLALVIGVGYEYNSPGHYQASGTIWADAPVPNGSSVFSQTPPNPSPAAQASSVLNELLSTDQFLAKVAPRSPWAAYLRQHPDAIDTVFGSLQKNTSVFTLGPQVVSVTYQSTDAATTAPMVRAIMGAFVAQVVSLQKSRDQQQITYDKQSLNSAASALSSSQDQLRQYLAAHPQAPGATVDPTVTQLSGNVAQAQQAYGAAVSNLNDSQLGLSSVADSSQLHVIDQPSLAAAQGRKKKIAYAGIGGLFAGLVIAILLLSWLVSKDTSPWNAEDVEDDLGLTVVGSIEELPSPRRQERGVL
jgi:capsular polysaccharide biosynthesis protein